MAEGEVVEIVFLRAKEGRSDEEVARAADECMPDLSNLPGYIRREVVKNGGGQWVDIIHWKTLADAKKAAELFPGLPGTRSYLGSMVREETRILHFNLVRTYDSS